MRLIKLIYPILSLVLTLTFFPGCQGPQPLIIESTYPQDGAVEIPMESDISISIDFSKPMNQEATVKAITIFPETTFEATWEADGKTMRLKSLTLAETTQYRVTINTEAMAEDGQNLAEEYTFSFETALKPPVCGGT